MNFKFRNQVLILCLVNGLSASGAFAEDVQSWKAGKPLPELKIRQQSMNNCWAYAFAELLESDARKHGKNVELSPEYLTFNAHAMRMAKDLYFAGINYQQGLTTMERALNTIEVGGEIGFAGRVADQSGMLPAALVLTPPLEKFVPVDQNQIAHRLIEWQQSQIERYTLPDDDGFQKAANMVYEKLFSIYGLRKVGSRATFKDHSVLYSPQKYLKEYLGFDLKNLKEQMLKAEQMDGMGAFVERIAAQVEKGNAATLSFNIVGRDSNEFSRATEKSDFAFDFERAAAPENMAMGSHVALVVNTMRDASGKLKALIIQNSIGLRGRDRMGQMTADVKKRGYDVLTLEYLKRMSWEGRNSVSSWTYSSGTEGQK